MTLVVRDLARHPELEFAVVIKGELLPIRFGSEEEATKHLAAVRAARAKAKSSADDESALCRSALDDKRGR